MKASARPVLFVCLVSTLGACGRNVLTYARKPYYSERSIIITRDSIFTLHQQVDYNVPKVVDEAFSYYLRLRVIDTSAVHQGMTLDLEKDTQIVRADYDIASVWNWEEEDYSLRGTVIVDGWTPDTVVLSERVFIDDRTHKEHKSFIGTRIFVHQEGW